MECMHFSSLCTQTQLKAWYQAQCFKLTGIHNSNIHRWQLNTIWNQPQSLPGHSHPMNSPSSSSLSNPTQFCREKDEVLVASCFGNLIRPENNSHACKPSASPGKPLKPATAYTPDCFIVKGASTGRPNARAAVCFCVITTLACKQVCGSPAIVLELCALF